MLGNILFDNAFSNPPYQSDSAVSFTQTTTKNIFQEFHYLGTMIGDVSSMIFPGGRWLQRVKRCQGMSERIYETADMVDWFDNDKNMNEKIFPSAVIVDGVSIVTWFRNSEQRMKALTDRYNREKKLEVITGMFDGSENIGVFPCVVPKLDRSSGVFMMNGNFFDRPARTGFLPLTPWGNHMVQQITESGKIVGYGQQHYGVHDGSVSVRKLPSLTFGIATNFVEKNPDKVVKAQENFNPVVDAPPDDMVFAFLGDERPGSTKRVRGYFVCHNVFKWSEQQTCAFKSWKVVGTQGDVTKRPALVSKYDIIPPNTVVGPAKAILGLFNTEIEAVDYRKYLLEPFIRRLLFESCGGKFITWGVYVPDLQDYTNNNPIFQTDEELGKGHKFYGLSLQERLLNFLDIK